MISSGQHNVQKWRFPLRISFVNECKYVFRGILFSFTEERFNSFHATGIFLYHLKTRKKLWFSMVFRRNRKKLVAWNVLMGNFFYVVVYSHIQSINEYSLDNILYSRSLSAANYLKRKQILRSCLQNISLISDIRPPVWWVYFFLLPHCLTWTLLCSRTLRIAF